MKKTTARFLWAVCIVGTITGCGTKGTLMQTAKVQKEEAAEQAVPEVVFGRKESSVKIIPGDRDDQILLESTKPRMDTSKPAEEEIAPPEEEPLEAVPEKEQDLQDHTVSEPACRMVSRKEDTKEVSPLVVSPPKDTTVPNEVPKEEETGSIYVKPLVDETDSATEPDIQNEVPVPSKYWNHAGDLRYEYKDGTWYEYQYSSGDIKLDEQNESLALKLLNLDGFYNGYDVLKTDCTREMNEDGNIQYEYHVRYRRIIKLEQKPSNLDQMQKEDPENLPVTAGAETEKTVPVLEEKTAEAEELDPPDSDKENTIPSFTGMNVSEQNGDMDWEKVHKAGVDYVMIRCAYRDPKEGILTTDSKAEANIKAARAAGIETGIFFTSGAVSKREAMEEADFAVMMAERYRLNGPVAVFVQSPSPEVPKRTDKLDAAARTACVKGFCQVVRMSGYEPVICGDADWLRENLKVEELSGYMLWIPQCEKNITYTVPCEDWYCTKKSMLDGISGYTGLMTSDGELGGTFR